MTSHRLLSVLFVVCLAVPQLSVARNAGNDHFYYLSPLPGSDWNVPSTTLIFRPDADYRASGWMEGVVVAGSSSGVHSGRWVAATDGRTFIFRPDRPFAWGERVDVSFKTGDALAPGYSFTVAPHRVEAPEPDPFEQIAGQSAPPPRVKAPSRPSTAPHLTSEGYELPDGFPDLTVTVSDRPSRGKLFFSPLNFSDGQLENPKRYLIIADNDGNPVFFRPVARPMAYDFKMQPDGRISFFHYGRNEHYLMDATFTIVDSVRAQNCDGTDLHDLRVLPNGNYLVLGYRYIDYDMSQLVENGYPDAKVVNMVVQEIDRDRNVLFEWRSWDHFSPLDAVNYNLTHRRVDYVHTNSLELDNDGNIILSHRHLDEITKVNRDTGEIMWHLGGKHNDFTLVGDTRWFSHQHSARRQADGTLTVFDNGNYTDPEESRAVEYRLDEVNMTATRVWEYRHDPPVYTSAMGDVQRLDNGNTMIGWGNAKSPIVNEVRPDGSKAFEMTVSDGLYSYRAFRFDFDGVAARPDVWATTHDNTLALNFTKFGDDRVAYYKVYGNHVPHPNVVIAKTSEHRYIVHRFLAGVTMHFRVTAVDRQGNESPFSNEIAVTPDFDDLQNEVALRVMPRTLNRSSRGEPVRATVTFERKAHWTPATAVSGIRLNGSVFPTSVRATSTGLDLEFPRGEVLALLQPGESVEVSVTGHTDGMDFAGYDRIRVLGKGGPGDPVRDGRAAAVTSLDGNVPNPFNPTTTIRYRVARGGSRVTIRVFDIAGRLVRTLVDGVRPAGRGSVVWNGRDEWGRTLASGVYFCRLRSGDTVQTRKLVLMK